MEITNDVPETITFAKKITIDEYIKQKDEYTQKALKELNEQMKQLPSIIKKNNNNNKNNNKNNNNKLSMSLPNSDNEQEQDNFINSKSKYSNSNNISDSDSDSDSDYNDNNNEHIDTTKGNPSLNFIIKHYVSENSQNSEQLLKKRKNTKNTTQNNTQNNTQSNQSNTMTDAIYAQHELDMNTITKLKLQNNTLNSENEDLDTKKHFLTLELSNAQCDVGDLKIQVAYLKEENLKLKQYMKIMKINDEQFELYLRITIYILIFLILLLIYIYF